MGILHFYWQLVLDLNITDSGGLLHFELVSPHHEFRILRDVQNLQFFRVKDQMVDVEIDFPFLPNDLTVTHMFILDVEEI